MVDDRGSAPFEDISWRRNLYALWIAQLLTIVGFSLRTPFLPFFLEDIGADSFSSQALWAGVINAGGAAVMAITAPIWGAVADRYGRRLMVLRAMFVASFTVSLMSLAMSPWHLLILRFVEGGFTGTVAASTTLVASTTPRSNRGFALGMMQMAVFSGASIGPLFGGVLADQIGFRPTFVVGGAMLFCGALIVLTQVREHFERPEPAKPGALDAGPSTRAILLSVGIVAVLTVMFCLRTGSSAIQPIMPLFVQQVSGATGAVSTLSGLTLGVTGVTSAIAAVVLGRLADRAGHTRILLVATFAAGLLYIPLAIAQSTWQLIAFSALVGIAAGGVMPSANAVVANVTPAARRGAIFGFTSAIVALGGFVGPLGGAALAAAVSIRIVFLAIAALMAVAGLFIVHALRSGFDFDAEGDD